MRVYTSDDLPIKADSSSVHPQIPHDPPILPFNGPDPVPPPRDVGGWLTLIENLKDTRGPVAARVRAHALFRLRQAGWDVRRIRKAVTR